MLKMSRQFAEIAQDIKQSNERMTANFGALTQGMMELLGAEIDEKYNKYAQAGEISEDEAAALKKLYLAYAANGGNGERERKYNYIMGLKRSQKGDTDGSSKDITASA